MSIKSIIAQRSDSLATINENRLLKSRISYYHFAFFLIFLPFDLFYSEIVLVSLMYHTLINFKKGNLKSITTKENLILSSVFILNLFAISWSYDKTRALNETTRQLAILLFPIIFSLTTINLKHCRKKFFFIFSITCLLTILYLYADALYIIMYNKLPISILFSSAFVSHNFAEPINIHATYLSMYVAMSIAIFFYFFSFTKKHTTRLFCSIALIILILGLLQLASKSVLIATIVFVAVGFPLLVVKKSKRIIFIITTLLIFSIIVYGITRIDSFKREYIAELKNDLTQSSINNEILEPRIIRWQSAISVIKESPVIGYGSGAEINVLKKQYFQDKLYNSYLNELNAHNQYLSFLINTGFAGLIIFLIILTIGFITAWQNKDILFLSFMFIICIVAFSENILSLNKGIFFYAFFFSLFLKTNKLYLKLHIRKEIT